MLKIQRHSGEGVNEPADVNMQEDESHSHSDDDEMEPELDDDNMGPPPLNMNMPPRPNLRPPIGANLFPHFPSRDHILVDHDPNIMDPPLANFLGPPLWGAGTYLRERDTSWEGRNRLFWKMPNSLGSREVCVCDIQGYMYMYIAVTHDMIHIHINIHVYAGRVAASKRARLLECPQQTDRGTYNVYMMYY